MTVLLLSQKEKKQIKIRKVMKAIVIVLVLAFSTSAGLKASSDNENKRNHKSIAVNNIISGTIIDEITGEALTGVEVKLKGSTTKTYTDFDGKFHFDKIKPGNYSIEANIISYQPIIREIQVNPDEMHDLNLELAPVATE